MPRKLSITTEEIIESILNYFNSDSATVTRAGVVQWAGDTGYTASTILARLAPYKSGRGKFSLARAEAVAELEQQYDVIFISKFNIQM